MSLRWKESRVGDYRVVHWARVDPADLLDALRSGTPARSRKNELSVHAWKNGQLLSVHTRSRAVDNLRSDQGFLRLASAFNVLRSMAKPGSAVVEMPVALVQNLRTGNTQVATLHKKNSLRLDRFLFNPDVPTEQKRSAVRVAVRKLARLHAAGFSHGHPKPGNALIGPGNRVHWVDYSALSPFSSTREMASDLLYFWDRLPEGLKDDAFRSACFSAYGAHYRKLRKESLLRPLRKTGRWAASWFRRFVAPMGK